MAGGLQKTQIHVSLTGIDESLDSAVGDARATLSVCENIEFAQKASPQIRRGYTEVDSSGVDNTYVSNCTLVRGNTPYVCTDRSLRSIVFAPECSSAAQVAFETTTGVSGASSSLLCSINGKFPNMRDSSGNYGTYSNERNLIAGDIYYWSEAPFTEKGLAVALVYPTENTGQSSTDYIPAFVAHLIDVATGAVIDRINAPSTYNIIGDKTSLATTTTVSPKSVRLVGHQDRVMVVVAGPYTYSTDVYVHYVDFNYVGFTSSTWTAGASFTSKFLNIADAVNGDRYGLVAADYDRKHADLAPGADPNIWVAWHCPQATVGPPVSLGEAAYLVKLKRDGTAACEGALSYGAAPTVGESWVNSIGVSAYNTTDGEGLLVIGSPMSSGTKIFASYNNSGSLGNTRAAITLSDASNEFHSARNSIIYVTPISVMSGGYTKADDDVISSGGYYSYGVMLSTTQHGTGSSALTAIGGQERPMTHVQVVKVGSASSKVMAVPSGQVNRVYQGMSLAAEPFCYHNSTTSVRTGALPLAFHTGTIFIDQSVKIYHVSTEREGSTYFNPPTSPCEAVIGALATGIYAPVADRSFVDSTAGAYGSKYFSSQRICATVQSTDLTRALVMVPVVDNADFGNSTVQFAPQGMNVYLVDLTHRSRSSVSGDYGTMLSVGYPMSVDGGRFTEAAFPAYPIIVDKTVTGAGGTIKDGDVYSAMFEYETSTGHVMWSALGNTFTLSNGGVDPTSVTIKIFTPRFRSVRPAHGIAIHLFRKQGTNPYRYVGTGYVNTATIFGSYTTYVTIKDTRQTGTLGTQLQGQSQPYYDPANVGGGSQLPIQPAAGLRCLTQHKDRIFAIDEDGSIRFTGPYVSGEYPWWSDVFRLSVPGEDRANGLASSDGRLLVFKTNSIYVIDGDGPPGSGGNGTEFSSPQRVTAACGCIEPRSIIETPYGVFYRSSRGIDLVSGSGKTAFIGESIQKTTEEYPYVVAAAFEPLNSCVKFLVSSEPEPANGYVAGTPGGAIICFYANEKAWTVHRIAVDPANDLGGSNFSDMAVYNIGGRYTTVLSSADGRVFFENVWSDRDTYGNPNMDPSGEPVSARIRTNDIRLADANNTRYALYEGEIAFKNGQRYNATMRLYYNYHDYDDKQVTFYSDDLYDTLQYLQITPDIEQIHAVKVEVEFNYDGAGLPAAGEDWDVPQPLQLAINVGIQDGFPRIPTIFRG